MEAMNAMKVRDEWGCNVTNGGNRERGATEDTFRSKNQEFFNVCVLVYGVGMSSESPERSGLFGFSSSEVCSAFLHEENPTLTPILWSGDPGPDSSHHLIFAPSDFLLVLGLFHKGMWESL